METKSNNPVSKMIVTIKNKQYEAVPSCDCTGCVFAKTCTATNTVAPEFNDYTLCADIDVIFKEITPKKPVVKQATKATKATKAAKGKTNEKNGKTHK